MAARWVQYRYADKTQYKLNNYIQKKKDCQTWNTKGIIDVKEQNVAYKC